MPEFTTIDDIEKHYGREIKAAGDDQERVRELQIEQREVRADFRERQATQRQFEVERNAVISEFRIDPELAALVPASGTIEEVRRAAALIASKTAPPVPSVDETRQAARAAYGNPAVGGMSDPAPRPDQWTKMQEMADQYNNAPVDAYGKKILPMGFADEYARLRGGEEWHERFKRVVEITQGPGAIENAKRGVRR